MFFHLEKDALDVANVPLSLPMEFLYYWAEFQGCLRNWGELGSDVLETQLQLA